jgi:hypothetical protein
MYKRLMTLEAWSKKIAGPKFKGNYCTMYNDKNFFQISKTNSPDPLATHRASKHQSLYFSCLQFLFIVTLQFGVRKELRESNGKMFFFLFHNSGRVMGE